MSALPITERFPKTPKHSRRRKPVMDFTPMVDLGFLLITFFMLTTSLNRPQVMPLLMPDKDGGTPQAVKQSKVLNLLLGSENRIYWYEGLEMERMDSTDFSPGGLRRIVLQKMDQVREQFGLKEFKDVKTGENRRGSYLNVIIKPGSQSNYQNLVDVLDEMNICRVQFYCIVDPDPEEAAKLALK